MFKYQLRDEQAFRWKSQHDADFSELSASSLIKIPSSESGEKINFMDVNFPTLSFKNNELVDFSLQIFAENEFVSSKVDLVCLKEVIK